MGQRLQSVTGKAQRVGQGKPTFSNTTKIVFNVQRAHHSSNTATNYGTRQSIPFYDMGLYEMTNIFLINSLETTNVYRELQYHSLLTLPEYLSSSPVFSGVRVTRSLVLYVCVVDRCSSFCTFSFGHCVVCSFGHCVVCSFGHCVVCSFGHCVVCSSSIYGF